MAIRYSIEKHNITFPTKVVAGYGGDHQFNLYVEKDYDNGVIGSVGAWKDFDRYTFKEGNAAFEGEIVEQAANGNWYVQVNKADEDTVYLCQDEVSTLDYTEDFKDLANLFNEAKSTVRGYKLNKYDIIEESAKIFKNPDTLAVGQKVTVDGAQLANANANTGA